MTPEALRDGLVRALDPSEGYTEEDLLHQLASGLSRLWIGERSALVTYVEDTEQGRNLHVWLGCGDMNELLQMRVGIEAYARAHSCVTASIHSRKGWNRPFMKVGFVLDGTILRKRL